MRGSAGKRLEKLAEDVDGNLAPVGGGRTHVVDWAQLGKQGGTSAIDDPLVERAASEHGFGVDCAHYRRGDTAKRQPDVGQPAGLHERGAGKAHLRDRLRAPGSDLAVVLMPAT